MIFIQGKYIELVQNKYSAFTEHINNKFNELNGLNSLNFSNNVIILHNLILSGEPFDRDKFTPEEYADREKLDLEETTRANKMMKGEIQPYHATEEDLMMLTFTLDEIKTTTISEEEHQSLLEQQLGQDGSSKV